MLQLDPAVSPESVDSCDLVEEICDLCTKVNANGVEVSHSSKPVSKTYAAAVVPEQKSSTATTAEWCEVVCQGKIDDSAVVSNKSSGYHSNGLDWL